MCVVSNIGDQWTRKLPDIWPKQWPQPGVYPQPWEYSKQFPPPIPYKQYEALRKELEEMKRQLQEARAQDIANNEPNCEQEDKVALLRKVAKIMNIDLGDVFD
jgi:hypothetical protein